MVIDFVFSDIHSIPFPEIKYSIIYAGMGMDVLATSTFRRLFDGIGVLSGALATTIISFYALLVFLGKFEQYLGNGVLGNRNGCYRNR